MSDKREPVVLVTAFEPFDGAPENPSAAVLEALGSGGMPGFRLEPLLLPVSHLGAPPLILERMRALRPRAVLMLGEARGSVAVRVERLAVNLLDFRIPDNEGHQPADVRVVEDGPAAFWSTLPVRDLALAVRREGIPCVLSLSAGSYLCNEVMYLALYQAARVHPPPRTGFIHLPSLPSQAARCDQPEPSMALGMQLAAVRAMLGVLQETFKLESADGEKPGPGRQTQTRQGDPCPKPD